MCEAARRLGYDKPRASTSVQRWFWGDSKPRYEVSSKIEALFGIHPSEWLTLSAKSAKPWLPEVPPKAKKKSAKKRTARA